MCIRDRDISAYQGEVDFQRVKRDGIWGVMLKATEGERYLSPASVSYTHLDVYKRQALLLTGCGEKRATYTNDNRPDVVQQGKQAGEDAAKGAKDLLDDGASAAKKMMENEQGMLMAAGSRIQDVIMELGETLGITMPQKMDQASLQEVFGLNPSDIEEYYGEYSSVNTSADHIIGVKVKEGRVCLLYTSRCV